VVTDPVTEQEVKSISLRQWAGVVFSYLLVPLVLFGISRDFGWWQAWVFSVLVLVIGVGGRAFAERNHPGLMYERMSLGHGHEVKRWDRVLGPLLGFCLLYPHVIVAGLDHYYGWTTTDFPLWVHIMAFVVITLGYLVSGWAIYENRFFSLLVRIQKDRGHQVCDTGPYRFMRHPGYSGNVISSFFVGLFLNSWWVMIPAVIALIIAVIRTVLEDRALMSELPGYQDYASRVRYKFVPGIW
jgi:protein-S-isoprenylcysteine O-methyltransferase Ste14